MQSFSFRPTTDITPDFSTSEFLKLLKQKLFSDPKDRLLIFNTVNAIPYKRPHNCDEALESLLLRADDDILQRTLAPILRKYTMKHLRDLNNKYSLDFALSAPVSGMAEYQDLEAYYKWQETNSNWASYIEAGALADLFNITALAAMSTTHINDRGEATITHGNTWPLKVASENRPVMRFYNVNDTHWYCHEYSSGMTIGDGNCLYNAFAILSRQIILVDQAKIIQLDHDISELTEEQRLAYEIQAQLLASIKHMSPPTMRELMENIKSSIKPEETIKHLQALRLSATLKDHPPEQKEEFENTRQLETSKKHFNETVKYVLDNHLKELAKNIYQQVITSSMATSLKIEVLNRTDDLLINYTLENLTAYQETINKVEGHPSLKLKALGGLMVTLGMLLITVSALAFTAVIGLTMPATVAIGVCGLASTGSSFVFFNKGKTHGLAKPMLEIASEVEPKTRPRIGLI
jgi:hypothetical protein